MATTTFDKEIYLGQEAAKRLEKILSEQPLPKPDIDDEFWDDNKKKVDEWLSRFKK